MWLQIGLALYRFFKEMNAENATPATKAAALEKGVGIFDRLFPKAKIKESMSVIQPEDISTIAEIVRAINESR
ncbi:MAG: hypothetical protein PHY02_09685 [Phycisphaerae bacterium]|nr:hypothetical protein [Phycisphaerae bacterium]